LALAELEAQNTVVFSGLNLKELNSNPIGEIDFIILSHQLKTILQVKYGL